MIKPHLRLGNIPFTDTKIWYCQYLGIYRVGPTPIQAYNRLADDYNQLMNWAPSKWLPCSK